MGAKVARTTVKYVGYGGLTEEVSKGRGRISVSHLRLAKKGKCNSHTIICL